MKVIKCTIGLDIEEDIMVESKCYHSMYKIFWFEVGLKTKLIKKSLQVIVSTIGAKNVKDTSRNDS